MHRVAGAVVFQPVSELGTNKNTYDAAIVANAAVEMAARLMTTSDGDKV